MADVYVDEAALQAIGSAIRSKNGLNTRYKPRAMAAAILSIPSTGGSATYFTVTMPSMVNQSFTVSVDGVNRSDGYSFTAEKGSIIRFTNPVADTGYTAGELSVSGGSRLQEPNAYCLTSDMTVTLTAAEEEVVVSGFDLSALRSGEVLTVPDMVFTLDNAGKSDWNSSVQSSAINMAIGVGNDVYIEYAVWMPAGNACSWGPEFIIYTNSSSNSRFSASAGTMHLTEYENGKLYTAVVKYRVNADTSNFPFYKQYGANSGGGDIKVRLRVSNLTAAMTPDVESTHLYPWS